MNALGTPKAPFPWFGGKSRAASLVWRALGDVPNYVEPFAGSLAVLLGRPTPARIETVNDLDAHIANVWRAVQADPDQVAHHADWPVSEVDLHARHAALVKMLVAGSFREQLMEDPEYFDAKAAGWWVWGICQWIGGGWCREPGESTEVWEKRPALGRGGRGVTRKLPDLHGHHGAAGRGVHAGPATWQQRPALAPGMGVHRRRPARARGRGVSSGLTHQLPDLSGSRGVHASARGPLVEWMRALSTRLRPVRVCCGDWSRVLTKSPTTAIGVTGVLLDPPYADTAKRTKGLYAQDSLRVAHNVRAWAVEHGANRLLRIVLCGYEGEHDMPEGWRVVEWSAAGGYGGGKNRHRERLWLSPHCLSAEGPAQGDLFGGTS